MAIESIINTKVDRLTNMLENLCTYDIVGWKINSWLNSDGSIPNLSGENSDHLNNTKARLNENINKNYCRIKKTIEIPPKILNKSVKGKIVLSLSLSDSGCLWINDECKGFFYKTGCFVLTEDTKPGEIYIIVIEIYNTKDKIRLISAELIYEDLREEIQKIKDFILSLKTGQKLLSFDTHQTGYNLGQDSRIDPKIDKSKFLKKDKIKL